jgi:hypothetical protein
MGPEPQVVWLVRPGSPEAAKGRLSLERHTLTFVDDAEDQPLPIPLNRVQRVRRRRAAPILQVDYTDARAEISTVFVYFAEPPSLRPMSSKSMVLPTRGLERTASAMSLRAAARALRPQIEAWVDAIRRMAGR